MARAYKKRTGGSLKVKLLAVLLVATAGFLSYEVYAVSLERYQINKQSSTVSAKLQELNEKNKDLKALVARLQDKAFLEKEARKKLNYQLPGEQSVIITQQTPQAPTTEKEAVPKPSSASSNARQWLVVLFGK